GHASGLDYYTIALPHQKELSRVTKALTDAGFEIEEKEEGVFVKDPVSGADIAFTL
ncbi:glyoxalase, partial [Bacillus velezensis]